MSVLLWSLGALGYALGVWVGMALMVAASRADDIEPALKRAPVLTIVRGGK